MASDGEDFDDLEALRQAALASVKFRAKIEAPQLEGPPSSVKADEDDDLSVLREAALRSTKISSALVTQNKLAVDHKPRPIPQHRRHHYHHRQRHSQIPPRQRHPYKATERKGKWLKRVPSQTRDNNLIVIPLAMQARNNKKGRYEMCKSQEKSGSDLELSSKKNVLLPQDKWARPESNVSEDSSSAVDRNLKKRKDGKFSRYDDSESDEDSMSDSDILSMSSESPLNKDTGSDSEDSTRSQQVDTRIVKREESKEIIIQKTATDNSELEATGDNLEIHDKVSSDSLLENYDEPLLDIQENGEIDDVTTAALNTSDKQVTDESFCVDILPSESLDLEEEAEPAGKEVFEARKKKFESTEEIKGSDLKKTISLKGIVPKSRKRHRRHHREKKLSHPSHKEELCSRDLKERNCGEVEDLRLKTSRAKDYHRLHNSGSSKSSDESCHSGNFSDSIGQPIRLKDHPPYHLGVGVSTSNHFNQPIPPYRENQRRVVQERSPKQNSTGHARYHLSDLSDSGEDDENSLLKKPSLSSVVRLSPNPKRQKTRKVLDSDQHSNFQKEVYSNDSKERLPSQPRGWAALIESRSKNLLRSKEDSDYHHADCDTLDVEELIDDKSSRFNFEHDTLFMDKGKRDTQRTSASLHPSLQTNDCRLADTFMEKGKREILRTSASLHLSLETGDCRLADEVFPAKKLEDRLSVHRWIGFTPKLEKSPENQQDNTGEKSKDRSKETELDQKILRIQEMNAAILKRQAEVKKDKERYG